MKSFKNIERGERSIHLGQFSFPKTLFLKKNNNNFGYLVVSRFPDYTHIFEINFYFASEELFELTTQLI